MEELINKLKEFKAADDSAKEMEETINEAINVLEGKEALIDTMTHNEEVLNRVIEKQPAQLQEKDKIINMLAIELYRNNAFDCDYKYFKDNKCRTNEPKESICKECIIEYSTKKAREV